MLNIVVPMAGRGSRFANAGYQDPKPLIRVGGKPMIQWVIENVKPKCQHRFIFLCLAEHLDQYPNIPSTLRAICPGCEIVPVARVTEGAACTVLLARHWIDSDEPLMIANSDQVVSLDIDDYLAVMEAEHADGLIMTFEANDPKWSYCRMKHDGTVSDVVEKQVVSKEATVGIYNFRKGCDFVEAADEMIERNLRTNGEFYVAPTYNRLIERGAKVVVARTGSEYNGMYGLGIPTDLGFFQTSALFDRGRLASTAPITVEDRILYLTRHYGACVTVSNFRGIEVLLTNDSILQDSKGNEVRGLSEITRRISEPSTLNRRAFCNFDVVDSSNTTSRIKVFSEQAFGTIEFFHTLTWNSGKLTRIVCSLV